MKKINVLVVDDSAFMRKVVTDIIKLDNELEVIGSARNGKEAIEKIKELSPDVITLDVEMPIMDGITALKIIIDIFNLPVLMLSSITKEGTNATLNALELGALDFITKPTNIFKMNTEEVASQIIEKIKIASKIKMETIHITKGQNIRSDKQTLVPYKKGSFIKKIVAIGTSTGGPRALQEIIPYIPKNIPASFLIVQHMPEGFTKSLAERLNNLSQIEVKEAENDEVIRAGCAYIAPGNYHMKLYRDSNLLCRIRLTKESSVSGHRPSVNVMMNSLTDLGLDNLVGVIMTGMGSDGAAGMKKIKEIQGFTIAQNENTCVVYGMPKAAISLGCIDIILPVEEIAMEITKVVGV